VVLRHRRRSYWCRRQGEHLLIRNAAGEELQLSLATVLEPEGADADAAGTEANRRAYVRGLAREAAHALGLSA